jgi:hypothetical protein
MEQDRDKITDLQSQLADEQATTKYLTETVALTVGPDTRPLFGLT